MRTFDQLIKPEQEAAVTYCLNALLQEILEGWLRFDDPANQNDLQARIDAAFEEANRQQTPWFAGECIMEAVGDELRSMAQCNAEDASYAAEDDPPVIRLGGSPADGGDTFQPYIKDTGYATGVVNRFDYFGIHAEIVKAA